MRDLALTLFWIIAAIPLALFVMVAAVPLGIGGMVYGVWRALSLPKLPSTKL